VAITIGNLSNKKGGSTFVDLHLDLQMVKKSNNVSNNNVVAGNDVIVDTDEAAIKNAIINGLTQRRYTNPLFGLNVRRLIGQPITDMGAQSLGDSIDRWITTFEPRAKVIKILVAPDYDNYLYRVVLILFLNNLNKQIMLNGTLNDIGRFEFI
jgi:phage baseplate assembly protein W